MIEVRTLNLTLRLVENPTPLLSGQGNYFIELSGESPFNAHKSFVEEFTSNANSLPFNSLEEVQQFVQTTAAYWQTQMDNYPKLNITGLQELTDIWTEFAFVFTQSPQLQNKKAVLSSN